MSLVCTSKTRFLWIGELPVQGERTYQWGNPGGMRDQYREGVVMGLIPPVPQDPEDEEKIDATARLSGSSQNP